MNDATDEPGFDPAALRMRYDAERDKRLRPDGNAQYVHLEGGFAQYLDDPYTEWQPREPIVKDVEIVIMGGGFGGLLAGARLHEVGLEDFLLVEKAGDFGGTWYWNRYPGAACDVESYIYLPLLEEVGSIPSEKYARAPEIAAHAVSIGKKFDLYRRALFQTLITGFEWDKDLTRWRVLTDRNDKITAKYVVMCTGHYQRPKLPGIPGIQSFAGHSFHTSRWDYSYTGGDTTGGLVNLQDKSIGIIGTGATAIQCVPHLGRWAKQLHVFQRTPSSVDYRGDRPTDPNSLGDLQPGWQKRRMDNFIALTSGLPVEEDLIDDSWTKPMFRAVRAMSADTSAQERGALLQLADYEIMEAVRRRVGEVVKDEATAEALKPWYNRLCKRPCFHDDYLETFNRPNVKLVDTAGRGVDRITEHGLVVDGEEYKVDCIIYATGFELGAFDGVPTPIRGRDRLLLSEKWKDGARTLHGIQSHGFPNFFIISTIQSAWGANFPHMMEEQARHIAYIIGQVEERGARAVEVTRDAEEAWLATHESFADNILKIWADCTPSYFNNEGKASPILARNGGFGGGVFGFVNFLTSWREANALEGLRLEY